MGDVMVDERRRPGVMSLTGFFVLHCVLWIGLSMAIPGSDRVNYEDLGIGSTPWVRQYVVALLAVLVVQVAYIGRNRLWREVFVDDTRTTRRWIAVLPALVLLLAVAKTLQDGVSNAPSSYWVGMSATMALVGITEELSFRGILLVGARRAMGSERAALLFSSVLFGLFHLPNVITGQELGLTLRQVVTTALIGTTFYCLRRTTRSIIPCIVLHAVYDWLLIQAMFS